MNKNAEAAKLRRETVKQFGGRLLHSLPARASAAVNRQVERITKLTGQTTMEVWGDLTREAQAHVDWHGKQTVRLEDLKPR